MLSEVPRCLLFNYCPHKYVILQAMIWIFTNFPSVGHYGGGLHYADVPIENRIPFSKVSLTQSKSPQLN